MVLQNTIKTLVDVVNLESAALASIAMQALGHIGLRVALPSLVYDSGPGKVQYDELYFRSLDLSSTII